MDFMGLALRLAKKGTPFPNPRVGAVIVKEGKVLGTGYHRKPGMPHAEIEAMREAEGNGHEVKGATLYVTLEPCSHKNKRTPPCTSAIIEKGINKVVYAMKDPNPLVSGAETLEKAGVKVRGPTAQKKAEAINRRYIASVTEKPFVAIKMAMSADGKTATRTGDSRWISGKESREYVQRLRTEYDAVMVGAETVSKDNPRLTARIKGAKGPARVIVDGRLSIPLTSRVMREGTILAVSERASKKKIDAARAKGAQVFVFEGKRVGIGLLVRTLGTMGMKKILIEGGSELNASALEAGVVERFYLFIAPKLIGGRDAKGVIGGLGIDKMSNAKKTGDFETRKVGKDILLVFDT